MHYSLNNLQCCPDKFYRVLKSIAKTDPGMEND